MHGHVFVMFKVLEHKDTFAQAYAACLYKDTCSCQKVQVGKDKEKAQSEKDSHSKNRCRKKTN